MQNRYIVQALLLVSAALPQAAPAQPSMTDQPTEIAPHRQCELHVWNSGGLRSVYQGLTHGGIVDGAVKGRDGYPRVPENPLDSALQHRLLGEIDLPLTLHLNNYTTILHEATLDSRAIRAGTRLLQSDAPCYAELIVDEVFLQQDDVSGNFLKTLFRFREFGSSTVPARSFATWAKTRLKSFPPQKGEPVEGALSELDAAYKQNITVFADYLNKPAKTQK